MVFSRHSNGPSEGTGFKNGFMLMTGPVTDVNLEVYHEERKSNPEVVVQRYKPRTHSEDKSRKIRSSRSKKIQSYVSLAT